MRVWPVIGAGFRLIDAIRLHQLHQWSEALHQSQAVTARCGAIATPRRDGFRWAVLGIAAAPSRASVGP